MKLFLITFGATAIYLFITLMIAKFCGINSKLESDMHRYDRSNSDQKTN